MDPHTDKSAPKETAAEKALKDMTAKQTGTLHLYLPTVQARGDQATLSALNKAFEDFQAAVEKAGASWGGNAEVSVDPEEPAAAPEPAKATPGLHTHTPGEANVTKPHAR